MWVEVNSRVNYPLKDALNNFVRQSLIDMSNDNDKFAVSWITCIVANEGIKLFVDAWNHHVVPGNVISFGTAYFK